MRAFLFLLFFFFIEIVVIAQKPKSPVFFTIDSGMESSNEKHFVPYCGTDELMRFFPKKKQKQLKLDKKLYTEFVKTGYDIEKGGQVPPYTLPVVVHIIHQGGQENISDEQVLQAISDLNNAFGNVGYYNQGTGVNTQIQFCLASRTPGGNQTAGINRINSPLTNMTLETDDTSLKALIQWDPFNYINIWLVNEICSSSIGCGVAGYAYFPSEHGSNIDGIVIESKWFGSSPSNSTVFAHEMGHYLGLYHTFEGGCENSDCLLQGDRVCDTPPDNSIVAVPCGAEINSCYSDTDSGFTQDQNDMYWNYMDYGNWECYSAFTEGQRDRMFWHIQNVRYSLLESNACMDPCESDISADFAPATNQTIDVGSTINFVNASTGASAYEWKVNGEVFSSDENISYTFDEIGTYEIELLAQNADHSCQDNFSIVLQVECPVSCSFSASNVYPVVGETVTFLNQSTNGSNFEWRDGVALISTNENITYTFPSTGIYNICLDTDNGICEKQFCQSFFVIDSTEEEGCESRTFVREIGDELTDEGGQTIIPSSDGNFYIGGHRDSDALILKVAPSGDILWQVSLHSVIGTNLDKINDMLLDSDGMLVITGFGGASLQNNYAYVIKFNPNTNSFIWARRLSPTARLFEVIEKAESNSYLLIGDVHFNNSPGQTDDPLILELNKTNGSLTTFGLKTFTLGTSNAFYSSLIYQGALYLGGRYTYSTGLSKMRFSITKMNLTGGEEWSKLYHIDLTDDARLYGRDILIENDAIYLVGDGDDSGTSSSNINPFFIKTNLQGDLSWVKKYELSGIGPVNVREFLSLPDGFVLFGEEASHSGVFYMLKTDKNGNPSWARSYSFGEGTILTFPESQIVASESALYFVAKSTEAGLSNVLLVKTDLEGQTLDECITVADLQVEASNVQNPITTEVSLIPYDRTTSFSNDNISTTNVSLEVGGCAIPCVDIDSCLLFPNVELTSLESDCLGEEIRISIEICNTGMGVLPTGMPITFYSGNPSIMPAEAIETVEVQESLQADSCTIIEVTLPSIGISPIYVMLNDNGSLTTPFDTEEDFPVTIFQECDFSNNLQSINLDFSPLTLDLGEDISICDNGVAKLDAGSGFYRYRWFDNSTAQTNTVWTSGTYWVEVTDSCGRIQSDTIVVTVIPTTELDLGNDTTVCVGEVTLYATGFDSYQWFPSDLMDCDTCSVVKLSIENRVEVIAIGEQQAGCYSTDTIVINVFPTPHLTLSDITLCENEEGLLEAITDFPPDFPETFEWIVDGEIVGNEATLSTEDANITQTTDVTLLYTYGDACDTLIQTATIFVLENNTNVTLTANPNVVYSGDSAILTATVTSNPPLGGEVIYDWAQGEILLETTDTSSLSVEVQGEAGSNVLYTVSVTTSDGCISVAEISIYIQEGQLEIPNVFTPNGDGINDIFKVFHTGGVEVIRTRIYNRWGALVFEGVDNQIWDGSYKNEPAMSDVYLYEVIYKKGQREYHDSGEVTLLR